MSTVLCIFGSSQFFMASGYLLLFYVFIEKFSHLAQTLSFKFNASARRQTIILSSQGVDIVLHVGSQRIVLSEVTSQVLLKTIGDILLSSLTFYFNLWLLKCYDCKLQNCTFCCRIF